jgi:hypothetical protein
MSSRRVAKLDDQCLTVTHDPLSDPHALQVRPKFFEFLRDGGYPVEDIPTVYNGVSLKEDGNSGYLVMEVETLDLPLDHDLSDATEDKVSIWVCSCPDFSYRRAPDLSEGERPSESGTCDHIDRCKRKERQEVDDDNQTTL